MIKVEVEGEVGNTFCTESTVAQKDYEQLVACCDTKRMTDADAKAFVAKEFGFAQEKIDVVRRVPLQVYVGCDRWSDTSVFIDRAPVYNATDYNYALFRVCGIVYEVWNGNLEITRMD